MLEMIDPKETTSHTHTSTSTMKFPSHVFPGVQATIFIGTFLSIYSMAGATNTENIAVSNTRSLLQGSCRPVG